MIDFKGKDRFIEIHDKLNAAGINVFQDSTGWHCSDPLTAQVIINAFTLEEAKRHKCRAVAAKAKELRDVAISAYSPGEMASWPIKLSEAAAYTATRDESVAPMLMAECRIRGITLDEMMNKVGSNASEFSRLEVMISGIDGKHRDAINALGSFEAVAGYDFSAGWPEV